MDHGEFLDKWDCTPELLVETNPLTHRMDEWAGILNIPADLKVQHLPVKAAIGS